MSLPIYRLGTLGDRIERLEVNALTCALAPTAVGGGLDDRAIDRVLPGRIAGQRGGPHQVVLGEARGGPERGHRRFVARQGPGLVAAQHRHGRKVMQGAETRDQYAAFG